MSEALVIREAQDEDSEAIAQLLGELGYPAEAGFAADRVRLLAGSAADRVFVAERGGQILGVASLHLVPLFHQPGNLCRVTSLVVAESARRRGIGRRLLQEAETFARSRDCLRIEITSGERREDAPAFYRRVGYGEESRRFVKHVRPNASGDADPQAQ